MLSRNLKNNFLINFLFVFPVLVFSLCSPLFSADLEKPVVFVSISPQKYFVEQIAGDMVEVKVLVAPGISPHAYEPLPQQMAQLSRARLFFAIGLPFEKVLLEKLKSIFSELKIVQTDEEISKRLLASDSNREDGLAHVHHAGCDHEAGAPDPHSWLDPQNVKIMAEKIAAVLNEIWPDHQTKINDRLLAFQSRLEKAQEEVAKLLKPYEGRSILVFHPAFGYFTDRFGLKQRAIEVEGKEPTPRQIVQIIRQAKAEKARVIFVQQQFSGRAAQTIAEAISGSVTAIDPLAEDYFANLKLMAQKIAEGLANE